MSETRRLGDLSLREHITIGNEVWEITGKNITGQVILEKVRNEYNPSWRDLWRRFIAEEGDTNAERPRTD